MSIDNSLKIELPRLQYMRLNSKKKPRVAKNPKETSKPYGGNESI